MRDCSFIIDVSTWSAAAGFDGNGQDNFIFSRSVYITRATYNTFFATVLPPTHPARLYCLFWTVCADRRRASTLETTANASDARQAQTDPAPPTSKLKASCLQPQPRTEHQNPSRAASRFSTRLRRLHTRGWMSRRRGGGAGRAR